jgi:hypothetical protein
MVIRMNRQPETAAMPVMIGRGFKPAGYSGKKSTKRFVRIDPRKNPGTVIARIA